MRDQNQLHYIALVLLSAASVLSCGAQSTTRAAIAAHYKHAAESLATGDAATAQEEFQAILKLDPSNAESYANLGVISYKKGDYAQAKKLLNSALQHNPSLWDAEALLGLSETHLGDTKSGIDHLETSFPQVHNADVKLDAGVAIIRYHQETKTLQAAVSVIQSLERAMPENPEVLYIAYRAYSELAAQELGALASKAPDSGRTHQVYGEASMTQDDFPGAITQFRKAIEADPALPGVHYQLGLALLTNAQDASTRQEAQQAFETELKRDPSDAHSEYELGEVFRLGTNFAAAQQHYTRALELRPEFAEAQVGLGTILTDGGKPEQSVTYFLAAVRLDPDNEIAHYRLARAYRTIGRVEDANREMASFQNLHQRHESRSAKPLTDVPMRMNDQDHASASP